MLPTLYVSVYVIYVAKVIKSEWVILKEGPISNLIFFIALYTISVAINSPFQNYNFSYMYFMSIITVNSYKKGNFGNFKKYN